MIRAAAPHTARRNADQKGEGEAELYANLHAPGNVYDSATLDIGLGTGQLISDTAFCWHSDGLGCSCRARSVLLLTICFLFSIYRLPLYRFTDLSYFHDVFKHS